MLASIFVGRRTALRTQRGNPWRFESSPQHKTKDRPAQCETVFFIIRPHPAFCLGGMKEPLAGENFGKREIHALFVALHGFKTGGTEVFEASASFLDQHFRS